MMATMHPPQTHEEVRTIWIGDLPYWVDENHLKSWFSHIGGFVSVRVIRNKITRRSEGYGFIEFGSHEEAKTTLQTYAGAKMPGTQLNFRLNWASSGSGQKVDDGLDHSIFVGDLAEDVTEYLLQETFRVRYPSVRGARVIIDSSTGRSKGYGFVKFAEESERNRAIAEMNGVYCSTRPMRIGAATKQFLPIAVYQAYVAQSGQVLPPETDVTCTTAQADPNQWSGYYGYGQGYDAYAYGVTQDPSLYAYGGYGYPQYPQQDGSVAQADPNQWSGYQGYGQGYDAYAYGTTQDPSLYAYGGYGYPQYPQQGEGSSQEVTNSAAADQELYDPLAPPDVDKLNAAYLSVHASSILGRPMWHCLSAHSTNENRRT